MRIQNGFKFSCQGKRACLLSQNSKEAAKYPLPCRLPKASVWEMEITVYPLHGQSIGPISIALNRGRLVTSIRHDINPSEPIQTWWGTKHGRQNTFNSSSSERPLFLAPFPIYTRWTAKQT